MMFCLCESVDKWFLNTKGKMRMVSFKENTFFLLKFEIQKVKIDRFKCLRGIMKPKIVSLKNLVVWKVRTTHLKNTLE